MDAMEDKGSTDGKIMKFGDAEVPVIPLDEVQSGFCECIGEAKPGKPRRGKDQIGQLRQVVYEKSGAFNRFWWKPVGAVESEDGASYVRVMKRRKLAILAVVFLALAIIELIVWLTTSQNAVKNAVDYIGSTTGLVNTNSDVKAQIEEYTSFESIPETIDWKAGTLEQPITLKNLDGNTVELAPQIYVDLDSDGSFSDDECVYNADMSRRIQAGNSVSSITLDHEVPAGTYDAEVVYRAFDRADDGTETAVNGMNFSFTLEVQ